MRYDELAHYGVRGMRWRNRKGLTIDPSNGNVRFKKPNGDVRVEKEKNVSMSGPNHRLKASERDVENKEDRSKFAKEVEDAAKKDQEDREAREKSARDAYDAALKAAKERAANASSGGSSVGGGGSSTSGRDTSSNSKPEVKNSGRNEKNAYYNKEAKKIASEKGYNNMVNYMNDVSKDPRKADILKEMNKRTYKRK